MIYNQFSMIGLGSFWNMGGIFNLSHFFLLVLVATCVMGQPSVQLYSSDYLLLSQNKQVMIPINNSLLLKNNNETIQFLKVTVKIQVRAANGTYIDSPFESGNIMVKYWKNMGNTPATQVLSYSYETISQSRKIQYSTDEFDKGLFDIEALHNYENEHNFMHSYGNELSDVLFVLSVYRHSETNLTDLLRMTKLTDEIKISISIFKATPSELKCSFCTLKTFCPTNQCKCYQETYSDCKVQRKSIIAKTDSASKTTDSLSLKIGTLSFIQVEPDNITKDSYLAQILMGFDDANTSTSSVIKPDRIFSLMYTQNRTDPTFMIPNIYNYDTINSPSFTAKITSETLEQTLVSAYVRADSATTDRLYLNEKVVLSKNEILTMAIYYLNDTSFSSSLSTTTNEVTDLNVSMEMIFGAQIAGLAQNSLDIGLVVGMIALGFFLLLVLICLLHFCMAKRFSIFSIFSNSESSNRTSMMTGRTRSRKITNLSQQVSTLPQITFDFIRQLVFRPLKFIYSPRLQQKSSKKTNSQKLTSHDQICSICLQQFTPKSLVKYTYCGHILDSKCIESWFEKEWSCPMCRQKLQPEDISEYEQKIMKEVWENDYYQNLLDEEVNVLKKVYKEWENKKTQPNRQPQQCMKYTEQSLVDNNFTSNKYIESTIHNISTMQQLQKSQSPMVSNSNKIYNKNENNKQLNLQNYHQKQSQLHQNQSQLHQNQSRLQQTSLQSITLSTLQWLTPVFQNNNSISFKRFIKIYRFYRCIYLYHQINKKFQKDSNLYEASIYFDEKDSDPNHKEIQIMSDQLKPKINTNEIQLQPHVQNCLNHDAIYGTSRKYMVREHQGDGGNRYNFNENNGDNVETNSNTEHKLKSTQSFKRIKNNKHGRAAFHLDFEFNELQIQPQPQKNIEQSLNENPIINPISVMQQNPEPMLIRQGTDSSQQSNALKLVQRGKCMSMREEMDGLQREFAGTLHKKSEDMNEDMMFRDHESLMYLEDDMENERYIEVLSPVVLSPNKVSIRRQHTNRSNQVPSEHMSRRTIQPMASGKKSTLSNESKKQQSPPNN